jgi:hypothetical protein
VLSTNRASSSLSLGQDLARMTQWSAITGLQGRRRRLARFIEEQRAATGTPERLYTISGDATKSGVTRSAGWIARKSLHLGSRAMRLTDDPEQWGDARTSCEIGARLLYSVSPPVR